MRLNGTLVFLVSALIFSFDCNNTTPPPVIKLAVKPEITYKTVKIGFQEWMAENLNIDHYRNGDQIPEVAYSAEWKNLTTGAWCYYNNDPKNCKESGKLYNWYAVNDQRGLAPEGWHVPTINEFNTLANAVYRDGNTLKVKGQGEGIGISTTTSGFSALFAGFRNSDGTFYNPDGRANFWSSTERGIYNAYGLRLDSYDSYIDLDQGDKMCGFSVRCVKD